MSFQSVPSYFSGFQGRQVRQQSTQEELFPRSRAHYRLLQEPNPGALRR